MRSIKSVWTKPKGFFFEGLEEIACLSVLMTLRHSGNCEIVTDDLGAEWIRELKLPVTKITKELNECPGDGAIWNEGKIFCNFIQRSPFIHTDLDVIQGRDWPNRIKGAAVVAERAYTFSHPWLKTNGLSVPEHWMQAIQQDDPRAFACGTYGGNDLASISEIAETGLAFIAKNRSKVVKLDPYYPGMVAEEWAIPRGCDWMEVSTVLPSLPDGSVFAARSKVYMHMQGVTKHSPEARNNTRRKLEEIAPGQAKRCDEVRKTFAKTRA